MRELLEFFGLCAGGVIGYGFGFLHGAEAEKRWQEKKKEEGPWGSSRILSAREAWEKARGTKDGSEL